MIAAIKDWLPITKRNRVALGFAVAALVMFVVWNCLPITTTGPFYEPFEGSGARFIWRAVFNPAVYVYAFKSGDSDIFLMVYFFIALFLHSILTLIIIPFWKKISAIAYLRIPFAIMTLVAGFVTFLLTDALIFRIWPPCVYVIFVLIIFSMFSLSVALFIFTNERILLNDMKIMKEMNGATAQRVLNAKKKS